MNSGSRRRAGPIVSALLVALVLLGAGLLLRQAADVSERLANALERQTTAPVDVVSDLDDAWFVVAAATPEVNRQVADAAESRRVFVNAVDDLASASAYLGGVVRKAGVTVAISTDGRAPALAGLLREGFETLLPDDLASWQQAADKARREWKAAGVPMEERRPLLLQAINRLYETRATHAVESGT